MLASARRHVPPGTSNSRGWLGASCAWLVGFQGASARYGYDVGESQ